MNLGLSTIYTNRANSHTNMKNVSFGDKKEYSHVLSDSEYDDEFGSGVRIKSGAPVDRDTQHMLLLAEKSEKEYTIRQLTDSLNKKDVELSKKDEVIAQLQRRIAQLQGQIDDIKQRAEQLVQNFGRKGNKRNKRIKPKLP